MTLSRRELLGLGLLPLSASMPASAGAAPPLPHGAVPSARHLRWHALERYAFVHFGINTFNDREWGYGDESPALFDPSDFDAGQIVGSARAAGLRGLILTAKHHDGFCLWPSAHTAHSVRSSPWRGGRGDVVREISDACRRQGLAFGIYLSPWDRHHADYGRPAYVDYFRAQLRELLTQYGAIFEIWFDGANGGDGHYGGARETRRIDAAAYYDWPTTWRIVRELQPDAAIWGQRGSDLRWVGNEEGHAGDPCWATMDNGAFSIEKNHGGVRGGELWRPAEVDVSIRPGWFWHAHEDEQVKSVGRLLRIEFESVGRGAGLLLNLAPDRRGRIPDHDAQVLREWGRLRTAAFGRDLARGALASASHVRGAAFAAGSVNDGRADTYWSCDDDVRQVELVLTPRRPATFDVVRLREHLPLGQRVTTFALDVDDGTGWREIARHQAIGSQRLVRLAAPVTARRVRLRILEAEACPAISEFALFCLPEMLEPPSIARDAAGQVSLGSEWAGVAIHYTVDGSPPHARSPRFEAPFALPDGGTVKAICRRPGRSAASAVATRSFDVAKAGWRISAASAPGAEALLDESAASLWRCPAGGQVTVDLGRELPLKGFTLLPAAHTPAGSGAPAAYACELSADGSAWWLAARGEFANIAANSALQTVRFDAALPARYLRLTLPRAVGGEAQIAFAGLAVLTR